MNGNRDNENETTTGLEIAIIGLAGRFPGSESIDEFWNNLKNGVESITFFSDEELLEAGIESELLENPNYIKAKGVIQDHDCFDASFFRYTPGEAWVMAPQVRLFHECAWEALEDAGYVPETYDGRIGLYAGASSSSYWETLTLRAVLDQKTGLSRSVDRFSLFKLNDKDYLTTRISHRLNLTGPSFSVQTACSTSLVAVHLAVQALLNGECEMALAGGVAVSLPHMTGYLYHEGMILSPDGHCRAFDEQARGTMIGEGAGIVVLKLLEDALSDGDHIYAVVKGSAINNDGVRKVGFSAPSIEGQAEVITTAQYIARVVPESITCLEAHGTGTELGDPVEMEALKLAFNTNKRGYCALGSVKTNIGHLDTAAGIAGLIKAVLALKYRLIPPSLHFNNPNPKLDIENSPFYINTELKEWKRNSYPLRAGVCSFGIGGTNAHMVLEEWPGKRVPDQHDLARTQSSLPNDKNRKEREYQLILLSARTQTALDKMTENLRRYFRDNFLNTGNPLDPENPGLKDAAYTLQVGRKAFNHRRMLVCSEVEAVVDVLSTMDPETVLSFVSPAEERPVVFMFPGQGSQYVNMGLGLYETEPVFREKMDRCFEILKSLMDFDIKEILYPPVTRNSQLVTRPEKINDTEIAQPLIFIFEYALAKLLMAWGIMPQAMIGHSIGEYTAACLAGVFSLEDALSLVVLRGKSMQQLPKGAMLSVPLSEEELTPLLDDRLSLAAVNAASLCVVSGPQEAVSQLEKQLKEKGYPCRSLHTSHAFHSQMMEPILEEFEKGVSRVKLNKPGIPYISNLSGTWAAEEAADPGYWVKHIRRAVRFADGLGELMTEPNYIFVEVGPGQSLNTFVKQHRDKKSSQMAVNLVRHPKKDMCDSHYLLHKLGLLWLYGVKIDWVGFYSGESRRRCPLPTYPFERQRYRLEGELFKPGEVMLLREPPAGEKGGVDSLVMEAPGEVKGYAAKHSRPELATPYTAPETSMEKTLAMICGELLGIEPVGIHDDFFELGGDSLKAMTFGRRIHKELDTPVPVSEFFHRPTIKKLAQYITENSEKSRFDSIKPAEKKQYYSLSSVQKRMYLVQQLQEASIGYNMPTIVVLEGDIDHERLNRSFTQLIKRHESLRTSFIMVEEEPVQRIHNKVAFDIEYYESGAAESHRIVSDFIRVFDLHQPPLLRVGMIKIGKAEHILVADMHHIVSDGTSLGVLVKDFVSLYEENQLPQLPLQYKDYAEREKREKEGEAIKQQESFWLKEYGRPGEIPVLDLPTDYLRPAVQGFEGSILHFQVDPGGTQALKSLALEKGVTLYMILLALYNVFLQKLTGQEVIVVGTPTEGRRHADMEAVIGMFVNTLALKNYPVGEKTFNEFLKEVKEKTLNAFANQDYQYEELVEKVVENRDASRNPLFDTMFILQNLDIPTIETPGLKLKPYQYDRTTSKFDLTLECYELEKNLSCIFEYSTKLFKEETIERFPTYLKQIIAIVSENPDSTLSGIDGVTEQEKRQVMVDFNDTFNECPGDKTIYQLFENQVDRFPDHVALVFKDAAVTFHQMDKRANQLANYLRQEMGLQTGDRVAVLMERSVQLIISLMGVMKAGGAYVPLDLSLPVERLRVVFNDASIGIVLSQEQFREKLTPLLSVCRNLHTFLCLENGRGKIDRYSVKRPGIVGANNPAYVMYTSGSSGTPKGVLVEHRTIVNTLWWRKDFYGYNPGSVSLQNPPYFFDSSVTDIFTPLLGGARLVLIKENERMDLAALKKVITANKVSHFIAVPAFYNLLLEEIADDLSSVKIICAAGEHFPDELVKKHFKRLPRVRITNEYGPTENSVNTTIYELTPDSPKALIGKPTWNVGVYILDRRMGVCPIGVGGEICLTGSSLAEGYLNNPELTNKKFDQDFFDYQDEKIKQKFFGGSRGAIFQKSPPGRRRHYRTGDLGRWLADGNLEFLGRIDTQVKIRGMRIETGEIENHLMRHDNIKEAVVLAHEGSGGEKYLCAYVVPHGTHGAWSMGHGEGAAGLKEFLSRVLPGYMIPSHFMVIDAIPLTASGKIDRAALPAPEIDTDGPIAFPRNKIENQLAAIWSEVLGKSPIGIDDNFFAIGGDSIKAIQIISRLNNAGYKTDVRTLFQHPTTRKLAPELTKLEIHYDQSPVTGRVPLSPLQEWFFRSSPVFPHHFNHAVMFYSRERIDPGALQAVFTRIQEHHDALRMTYKWEMESGEEQIVQTNHGLDYPLSFQVTDSRNRENSVEALEAAVNQLQASINLETGPLMKPGLFHLDDGDRLLIVIHHLVIDGISWRILFEDIGCLMQQYKDNAPLTLPLKANSFKSWVEKLHEYASSERLLEEKAYWEEQAALPIPTIKKDFEGGDNFVKDTASVSFRLSPEETEELLTGVNQAYGTEINDILLTALGLGARKTWSHNRLFIALEGHGRESLFEDMNVTRTIGWFTSHYPVLLDLSFEDDLGRQVKEVKETLRKIPNKGMGYGILKYLTPADSKKELDLELQPPIIFNYLGQMDVETGQTCFELAKESVGNLYDKNEKRQYELEVIGRIKHSQLTFTAVYSKKQYKPGTIKTLFDNFKSELVRVIGFCASKEKREFTPSDFTYPHLAIEMVDRLNHRYRDSIEDIYPLTPMQRGMLFHSLQDHSSGTYFQQLSFRLNGVLDLILVEKSLNELFKRHHVLRTAFIHQDVEKPLQLVLKERWVDFYYEDISDMTSSEERERLIREFKLKDRQRSFDLSKDVLMRISILQSGKNEYEFIWSVHHILMDGWCTGILIAEFFEIYTCLLEKKKYHLPPVTPYRNYIQWLEKQNKKHSRTYWKRYLDSYEEAVLVPGKKSQQDNDGYKNENIRLEFDSERTVNLDGAVVKNHVTVNTFIQAVWAVLLGKYNGREDVVFGSVVSGRPAELEGVETMVGLFINTIPVRIQFKGDTKFNQLLHRVQQDALTSEPHHYHPLAEIQSESFLKQGLINHILVFENYPPAEQIKGYENKKQSPFKFSNVDAFEQTNYDFNVIIEGGSQLVLRFNFNGNVFDTDFVNRMADHFRLVVDQVVGSDEIELEKITLLSDREKHRILVEFNDTEAWYPGDKTIHQLFEEQVERTPDHVALLGPKLQIPNSGFQTDKMPFGEDISITYKELSRKSNQMALLLQEKGVETGTIAGIMVERSIEMMIGIMGILKAGGVYLPIAPDYPGDRIKYMLTDCGAKVLLTIRKFSEKAAFEKEIIYLEDYKITVMSPEKQPAARNPQPAASSLNLAYIIYTSGSTGNPKGVMIQHPSVVNRLNWMQQFYPIDSRDMLLQKTPFIFDVSVWELFWWSFRGACLCLLGVDEEKSPDAIVKAVEKNNVTVIHFVPSMLTAFLDYIEGPVDVGCLASLKRVFASGEALSPQHVTRFNRLLNHTNGTHLVNLYGPTEATVDVSYYDCSPQENPGNIPIGKPIDNIRLYIVDKHMALQPVGIPGELCIGGGGLARGYVNKPELTGDKFDPYFWDYQNEITKQTFLGVSDGGTPPIFLKSPPGDRRLYKTGDLARWLPDGNIEFLGRIDHQVKIRGFRIELGDIENHLKTHPGVKDVVVISREERDRQYLCAYFTVAAPSEPAAFSGHRLKGYLEGKCPGYMVPACFVKMEKIPLNINGKIDRKMLPQPLESDFHSTGTYEAPQTNMQQLIAETWKEVLGRETVGIRDNFFDLGGNSLDFATISNKLKEKLGKEIPVVTLFAYPTIRSLELFLMRGEEQVTDDSELIDEGKDLMHLTLNKLDNGD